MHRIDQHPHVVRGRELVDAMPEIEHVTTGIVGRAKVVEHAPGFPGHALRIGKQGHGVFVAPMVLDQEVRTQHGARLLGEATDLIEEFYVITVERRITHPGVAAITQAARAGLFAAWNR